MTLLSSFFYSVDPFRHVLCVPLCVPIDIMSLLNVEDAPIVIPSNSGLDGELAYSSPVSGWLEVSVRVHQSRMVVARRQSSSSERRSSYNVLKLFVAFELGCSCLDLCSTSSHSRPAWLERIVFFFFFCSWFLIWMFLKNSSSPAMDSERFEILWNSSYHSH